MNRRQEEEGLIFAGVAVVALWYFFVKKKATETKTDFAGNSVDVNLPAVHEAAPGEDEEAWIHGGGSEW